MATMIDLENRDPNNINDHITCNFEDVIAEPESTHSIDCVWSLSYSCFNCCKNFCYKIASLLCGICIAMEWGIEFATISFAHIWCLTPCFKILDINCGCARRLYKTCVHCCCEPVCEACGLIFSAFKRN